MIKDVVKKILKRIPIAFTKNQQYDRDTRRVIKAVCRPNSNCIDVGCHKGEILDLLLAAAPQGKHFAFEPIPNLFEALKARYSNRVSLFPHALSDEKGETHFNYVVSNPSYSGIQKRRYDRPDEEDTLITVPMDTLDHLIPPEVKIDLIKIDVEGGEFGVLKGGTVLISTSKPVVIFEHGIGASDVYGTTPGEMFLFFEKLQYKLSTMNRWLAGKPGFTRENFEEQYHKKLNYYFIAYPG